MIKPSKKVLAGLAGLALLAGPLAACGSDDSDSSSNDSSSSSESSGRIDYLAQITDLSQNGGDTSVKLDPGFLEALTTLKVTPSPFEDATLDGDTITFPITGGNVGLFKPGTTPDYVVGQVQHEGSGLNLEAGGTTVTVGNFNVDPVASLVYGDVAVDDAVAATDIPIFRLDGTTLQEPDLAGGGNEVTLQGSGVFLTEGAATLLNDTFGIQDLSGDVKVGVATIKVKTA
ncbi:hypothetical protein [Nocardioides sp.]|uniref:hypothetical protein n=1 Tax=Nocardioides sp. TaxID=35761 RepID=UPI002722F6AF|nr:hypothetical protein [Nocardioides sp.]MDO9457328.1 hypothetical protein [Nocardioides sp.]